MGVVMKIIDKITGSTAISIAIYLILFTLVPGCGEFNDNPRETKMKLTVDISELKKQFGYSSDSDNEDSLGKEFREISGPGDSDATSAVESLVIGAVVITRKDEDGNPYAYNTDEALTDEDMEDIEDDVLNSAAYIDFVNLPTTENTIEFLVPPPSAENWQVAAIGVDFKMDYLGQLDETDHDDAIMYYGFTSIPYHYDDIKEDTPPISLTMKRACLANETVLGCATYSNILSVDPIVTSAVEIVDVKINGVSDSYYSNFPIIVRSETEADAAIVDLNSIKDYYSLGIGDDLTIETTHSKNPFETDACKAFANDSFVSVNELTSNCEVQTYKVPITHLD